MNAMSMLTRGYICPTVRPDQEVVLGDGPEIVDLDELIPEIVGGEVEEDE